MLLDRALLRLLDGSFCRLSLFHLLLCVHHAISLSPPSLARRLGSGSGSVVVQMLGKEFGYDALPEHYSGSWPLLVQRLAALGSVGRGAVAPVPQGSPREPLSVSRGLGATSHSAMLIRRGFSHYYIHSNSMIWVLKCLQFAQQHVRVSGVGFRLESIQTRLQLSSLFLAGLVEWLLRLFSHVVSLKRQFLVTL